MFSRLAKSEGRGRPKISGMGSASFPARQSCYRTHLCASWKLVFWSDQHYLVSLLWVWGRIQAPSCVLFWPAFRLRAMLTSTVLSHLMHPLTALRMTTSICDVRETTRCVECGICRPASRNKIVSGDERMQTQSQITAQSLPNRNRSLIVQWNIKLRLNVTKLFRFCVHTHTHRPTWTDSILNYTVSQKSSTFKLSVTLSNLNQWKAYEICYKIHTLSTSP